MTRSPSDPPRLLLLTGPAGSGKTRAALERIRDAATTPGARGRGAAHPGEALLILPTYSLAQHFQRIALSRWTARALLDDPFATFTSAGERFLDGFRVRALPGGEERDRFMAEALRRAAPPAFAGVASRPGFRARLLRLVKEVKQSGRPSAESRVLLERAAARLPADAAERLRAFLAVFSAYDALLGEADLEDHEDTLRRLLEHLRAAPPTRAPAALVVDAFDDFTPVEQGILDALTDAVVAGGGDVLVTLPWDPRRPDLFADSASARRHLLQRGFAERALDGFGRSTEPSLSRIARDLFLPAPPALAPEDAGETVRLVVAGDPEDEAEAVAREARRRMEQGDLPRGWRDLGVIGRRLEEAGPRLSAAFDRLGIPHRLVGAGRPLGAAGLVRALAGPLALLARAAEDAAALPVDAPALAAWLRWRAFAAADEAASQGVDALEIEGRRHGFPTTLQAWLAAAARHGLDASGLERHRTRLAAARGARDVHEVLEGAVVDLAPLPPEGGLAEDGRPRDAEADRHRLHAAAARDRLVALVRGLAHASARSGFGAGEDARSAVAALVDAIEHARLALPDRRLDVVNVLDAEEARFWELPVVFVVGLAQGSFPLRPSEDVVLRDEDRDTLRDADGALALPLARERETRERRLFYGALTRARRGLVLFRSGSTADGDPRSPSLFLRDLAQAVGISEDAPRPAGRPAPLLAECFTTHDLALFAAATVRTGADEERRLARALLVRGEETLEARAARWRRSAADPLRDATDETRRRFVRSVARVSASSLNAACSCRHRHFLGKVVGVPEDEVPFGGPAFGFRDEGSLLHEALRLALLEPDATPAEVAERVLGAASARRDLAPLDDASRGRLAPELVRVVALFRRREEEIASPLSPLEGGLERSFGEAGREVVLGEGDGRFALRGKIDRVDARGRRAAVLDYKRSASSVEAASRSLKEGVDLQLPLYAAAVEHTLDLEVVGFEWVAATTRSRRGRWNGDADDLVARRREDRVLEVLPADDFRALIDEAVARAGAAVAGVRGLDHDLQREDAERCGRCAYFSVCRTSFVRGRTPETAEAEL